MRMRFSLKRIPFKMEKSFHKTQIIFQSSTCHSDIPLSTLISWSIFFRLPNMFSWVKMLMEFFICVYLCLRNFLKQLPFSEMIITYFSHFLSTSKEGWLWKLIQLLELWRRKKFFCVILGTVKISLPCKEPKSQRVNAGKTLWSHFVNHVTQ